MPRTSLARIGPDEPLPVQLYKMIFGYRVSQAIYAAAKLGIPDLLAEGPKSGEELAQATETHPPSLARLLRALVSVEILAREPDSRFALMPLGALLRSDARGTLRYQSILYGEAFRWQPWGEILHSVRTGQPAFDHLYEMGTFDYFAANPTAAEVFDQAMTAFSAPSNLAIREAYDFSPFSTLVEVGGGHGSLIATLLDANPRLRGVLFDRPPVVEGARQRLAAAGLAERCEVVGGDFFEAVPAGGDLYLLKAILHDWPDGSAAAILASIRRAITPEGRLLVVDAVMPEVDPPYYLPFIDLNMLVVTGGRERTEADFRTLFASAGFRLTRILPTRGSLSLVEGEVGRG